MIRTKSYLKSRFRTGMIPTQEDYEDLIDTLAGSSGSGGSIDVDENLDGSSTNPVQNKAVHAALQWKVGSSNVAQIAIVDGRLVVTLDDGGTYEFVPVQREETGILLEDGSTLTAEDGSVIVF